VVAQDLLDQHVDRLRVLQAPEVGAGVVQAVRVVYAQTVHPGVLYELQDEPVRRLEDLLVLDTNTCQVVDGEEAPVVDLIARHPPVGEPVRLRFQEAV
jgi:hypothetical protein